MLCNKLIASKQKKVLCVTFLSHTVQKNHDGGAVPDDDDDDDEQNGR